MKQILEVTSKVKEAVQEVDLVVEGQVRLFVSIAIRRDVMHLGVRIEKVQVHKVKEEHIWYNMMNTKKMRWLTQIVYLKEEKF